LGAKGGMLWLKMCLGAQLIGSEFVLVNFDCQLVINLIVN
jgi:hypothetical protein